MEVEEPCLYIQANGALSAGKLHTIQPNAGVAERSDVNEEEENEDQNHTCTPNSELGTSKLSFE
jgi:hypothetical protein